MLCPALHGAAVGQDENANPSFDMRTQQSPSSGDARQHLRFLQQQRQLRQLQAATTAAATTGLVGVNGVPAKLQAQHQQRQQLRDKPAWQSDVYVAPPSQLLKRKNAGFADVWNMQPRRRPSSGEYVGATLNWILDLLCTMMHTRWCMRPAAMMPHSMQHCGKYCAIRNRTRDNCCD